MKIKMRKDLLAEMRAKRDREIVRDYVELSQKYNVSNIGKTLAQKYNLTVQRIYQILNEQGIGLNK